MGNDGQKNFNKGMASTSLLGNVAVLFVGKTIKFRATKMFGRYTMAVL